MSGSSSTVRERRFEYDQRLPVALVKKVVRTRLGRGRRQARQAEDVAAASISDISLVVVFQFRIVILE